MTSDTEAGHSVKAATAYIVLELATPGDGGPTAPSDRWKQVGTFTARSAEHAIRQHAEKTKATETLVLVAIPARSWQPVRVTVKTETRLEVSAA